VGEKKPNPFGLYDMHGNIWQWVQDCEHANYQDAPVDGVAWVRDSTCARRVIRGGAYDRIPQELRSARRESYLDVGRMNVIGFRVARMLFAADNDVASSQRVCFGSEF